MQMLLIPTHIACYKESILRCPAQGSRSPQAQ